MRVLQLQTQLPLCCKSSGHVSCRLTCVPGSCMQLLLEQLAVDMQHDTPCMAHQALMRSRLSCTHTASSACSSSHFISAHSCLPAAGSGLAT